MVLDIIQVVIAIRVQLVGKVTIGEMLTAIEIIGRLE